MPVPLGNGTTDDFSEIDFRYSSSASKMTEGRDHLLVWTAQTIDVSAEGNSGTEPIGRFVIYSNCEWDFLAKQEFKKLSKGSAVDR